MFGMEAVLTRFGIGVDNNNGITFSKDGKVYFANNEIAPKKAYVSVRSKKQFAMLQPSTKSRFDIGLIIKNQEYLFLFD